MLRTRTRTLTAAAGAIIAAVFVIRYVSTQHAFFAQDDYIYMSVSRQSGRLSLDWLTSEWFQHAAPLHRLAFSAMSPTAGSWALTTGIEIGAIAVAAGLWWALLLRLFGLTPWLLPAVAWFALSPALVPLLVWPSAGAQMVPDVLCSVIAVYAAVRHAEDGRRRWVAIAGIALVVGLLFYIRPILIPLYALLVRFIAVDTDLRPRAIAATLNRERAMWGTLVGIVLVYVIAYFTLVYPGAEDGTLTLGAVVDLTRIVWLRTLAFTAMGLDVPDGALTTAQTAAQIGAVLVAAAVVGWTLRRRARRGVALRGWLVVLVVPMATMAVVGTGRLASFGPEIGYDLRYLTNTFWLAPIGVLVAFRGVAAPVRSPQADAGPRPRLSWSAPAAVATVAVLAFSVAATRTSSQKTDDWLGAEARPWVLNASHDLRRLGQNRGKDKPRLSEATVPAVAVAPGFAPANSLTWFVAPITDGVEVVPAGQGDVHLDASGRVRAGP